MNELNNIIGEMNIKIFDLVKIGFFILMIIIPPYIVMRGQKGVENLKDELGYYFSWLVPIIIIFIVMGFVLLMSLK